MKIYIATDIEGISGIVEFEDRKDETPRNVLLRQRYSRLLTGEVNAAIDGAFAAGATEVLVNDAHGSGYTIDVESLDPRVRVYHGRARPAWMVGLDESFAAMMFIGAHAMAGTRCGVLFHTMSLGTKQYVLNDSPIGEIGLCAFCGGAYGVPMLCVTGNVAACREAEALLPGVTTVAVKEGFSRYSAIAWPPAKAREMVREGAIRAMKRLREVKPFLPPPPYTLRADLFAEPGSEDCRASDPDKLPAAWTPGTEIRAETAKELIGKAWGS